MNRVDLTKIHGILRSQDLLDFIQQSYTKLFAGLAAMISNNVIVAGVTDLGTTYSDGWVVINGELLPFVGGLKAARIIVVETVTQEKYGNGNMYDAFYTRVAQCAGAGGTLVSAFTRISNLTQFATITQLNTAVSNLVNGAPGILDTLKELADALGDDANFATTVTAAIAGKVAKTGDVISGTLEVDGGFRTGNSGAFLKTIELPIGDWNMDANPNPAVAVALPFSYKKARITSVVIRNDADTLYTDLSEGFNLGGPHAGQGAFYYPSNLITFANEIGLVRLAGGDYDNANYSATGYNRGWVTIQYEA